MPFFDGPTLGKRISQYRRENGWSMEELASRTRFEIKRDVIANIESGRKKDLTVDQLMVLATALEISPAAILVDITKPGAFSNIKVKVDNPNAPGDEPYVATLSNWQALEWISGTVGYSGTTPASRSTNQILLAMEAVQSSREYFLRLSWLQRESLAQKAASKEWTDADEQLLQMRTEQVEQAVRRYRELVARLVALGVEATEATFE